MDDDLLARRSPPNWTLPLLVALTTVAAFSPVLQNGFVDFDDPWNFLQNPHYRGLGPVQLKWMFTTAHMALYIPLTWMTLGFDYLLWGMDPRGYHLTNLLLHVANVVIFYFVALRLLRAAMTADGAGGALRLRFGAAFAAGLFAVHPLRVESVAWVTERRDVLSGLFYLLAVLAYLRFCEPLPGRSTRRKWYWSSVALFFLALASKPIALGLPAVLLALDVYPLRRLGEGRNVWVEKIPFAVLGAAAGLIAFFTARYAMVPLSALGPVDRLGVSFYGLAFYLWKTVAPLQLSPVYQLTVPVTLLTWPFLFSGVLVMAISGAAIVLRRRWPGLAVAGVSYLVILLPVVGVVQNGFQIAADRYSYLACLGWAVLAGGGLARSLAPDIGRRLHALVPAAATGLVTTLAFLTWHQVQVWRDPVALWTHAISVDQSNSIAAKRLMIALIVAGRISEGHAHFKRTIPEIQGRSRVRWFFTMARELQVNGNLEEAAGYYQEVIALDPHNDEAWNNLGVVYATRGETSQALDAFLRALEINPRYEAACENGRRSAQIVGVTHAVLEQCGRR